MTYDRSSIQYARRWRTLAVLSLSLLIIGLDNTILNVALPSLQEEFDASTSTLQWMVDSYLLVFAGLLLAMGTLGDRFGRKRALQTGLILFGGASLMVLFVETSGQLIAVRAVMGIGGALIMPATLSIISNVFPREERAKAIGIWSATAAVGVGLGPLFGGILLEFFDWKSVFLLNVPVAFIALVRGFSLVPESRDPHPGRFDFAGVVLSVTTLVSLVYGIIEAPEAGWTSASTLGFFGLALALGAAFIAWELRTKDPMLNLSFFRDPRFSIASLGLGLASFALFGAIFAMTQFLQDALGYSALEAGAAMVPIAFGLVIGSGSSIKLTARFGTRPVIVAGLIGVAVVLSSALLWRADMSYLPIGLWFIGMAMSMGWILAPATHSVMGSVPEEKAGVASAMNDVTSQVAGALGTAVVGSLVTSLYTNDVGEIPVGSSDASSVAFTDAVGIGFAAAAVAALVGAAIVRRWLPGERPTHAAKVELPSAIRAPRRFQATMGTD